VARKHVDPERRIEIGRERRARTRARIVAAAFEVFGSEDGLYARIEDVADKAEVTRATFYNHFTGMAELREALTYEVTHAFLEAVTSVISQMPDARDRSACAVRLYLHRARTDRRWAWSMINLSATGRIFGAETFRQAEQTVREGDADKVFVLPSVDLGRDLLLGTTLAAMAAILRDEVAEHYPEIVARAILVALGVPLETAEICVGQALPTIAAS
jgi:AcrR family transcriptional regulator